MTAKDEPEAVAIARVLLEKKLVACANILPPVRSLYFWEGKIEDASEVVVIFKSRKELFSRLKETVLDLHSYSCPCLVALPLSDAPEDYLSWLADSTKNSSPAP
jgi:periplasmic divalent cation tolerance protein